MKPLPHHYEVNFIRGPSGYAELSTAGVPSLRTAPKKKDSAVVSSELTIRLPESVVERHQATADPPMKPSVATSGVPLRGWSCGISSATTMQTASPRGRRRGHPCREGTPPR